MIYRNPEIEKRASAEKKMQENIVKNGEMLVPVAHGGIMNPDERTKKFLCNLESSAYVIYVLKEFNEYAKKLGLDAAPKEEVVKENVDVTFKVFEAGFATGYKYQADLVYHGFTVGNNHSSAEESAAAFQSFLQKEDAEERERNKDFYASFGEFEEQMHVVFRDALRRGSNQVTLLTNKFLHKKPHFALTPDGDLKDLK